MQKIVKNSNFDENAKKDSSKPNKSCEIRDTNQIID